MSRPTVPSRSPPAKTAATGDDLTVNSGVTIQSTASAVLLLAGDNFTLTSGSRVAAFGNISLTSTDTTADAAGSQFTIAGDLDAPQAILTGAPTATPSTSHPIRTRATCSRRSLCMAWPRSSRRAIR